MDLDRTWPPRKEEAREAGWDGSPRGDDTRGSEPPRPKAEVSDFGELGVGVRLGDERADGGAECRDERRTTVGFVEQLPMLHSQLPDSYRKGEKLAAGMRDLDQR